MTTKPPDLHVAPPSAQGTGRPAVHVPPPTQSAQPAQRILSPGITPADLEQQRGRAANAGRQPTGSARGTQPGSPQHVPAPSGAAPRGARAPAGQGQATNPAVTQTRGQSPARGANHVPNQNARSSPAARQGQHVPDQTASRARAVPQVPTQQPPPPPSPHAPQAPPPPPAAAAPPAPGAFDQAPPIPNTDAEFVSRYRDQARKLRARGARPGTSPEEAAEYERRAAWYTARADVKESDGFMPRALRTPAESVEGADYFRRALVGLLDGIVDLDGPEAGLLAGAVHGADPSVITRAAQLFNMWRSGAELLVSLLGVERGEFNAEKPGERWKFRTPNLGEITAAAAIVDARRVQEEEPPSEQRATEAPPPPHAAPAERPPATSTPPATEPAPPTTAPPAEPPPHAAPAERPPATSSPPATEPEKTSEATPPAATPEKP